MSSEVDLWFSWAGDRQVVRDFFFDAAKCDRYAINATEIAYGRPNQQTPLVVDGVQDIAPNADPAVFAIANGYNWITVDGRRFPVWGFRLGTNHHVQFRLSDTFSDEPWFDECLLACLAWVLSHDGDLLVSTQEIPLLARIDGKLIANSDAQAISRLAPLDGEFKKHLSALSAARIPFERSPLPLL